MTVLIFPGNIRYVLLRGVRLYHICVGCDDANKDKTRTWPHIQDTQSLTCTVSQPANGKDRARSHTGSQSVRE